MSTDSYEVGLGWRFDLEDRVYLANGAPFTLGRPERVARKIDPTPNLKIFNQGRMGSCAGHGSSTCCDCLSWWQSQCRAMKYWSRFAAYILGQEKAGIQGDQGCTISAVVASLMSNGIPPEEACPYPDSYRPELITPEIRQIAKQTLVRKYSKLKGFDDTFNWLASGVGAVVIGIPWTEELAQNDDGKIEQSRGQRLGGHCVAIVGYDENQWPILVNSHGEKWGARGIAIVKPQMFDSWAGDGFSELIGISDLDDYGQGPARTVFLADNPW